MNTPSSDALQEREQLLRKVFSDVAHDLKTPLACIIGSLEIMQRLQETLSPQDREILMQTAITEAHRLDGFISDMLGKAKP